MKHTIRIEDAPQIWEWITGRGGIAIWQSINLSNLDQSWTTPANQKDGSPYEKPTWQAGNTPTIITDPEDIIVSRDKLVKRFHVALRVSGNGLMLKCTDASSERIRKALAKAGEGAYHRFDYETQDALIFAPVEQLNLRFWHDHFSQEVIPNENHG